MAANPKSLGGEIQLTPGQYQVYQLLLANAQLGDGGRKVVRSVCALGTNVVGHLQTLKDLGLIEKLGIGQQTRWAVNEKSVVVRERKKRPPQLILVIPEEVSRDQTKLTVFLARLLLGNGQKALDQEQMQKLGLALSRLGQIVELSGADPQSFQTILTLVSRNLSSVQL